MGETLEGVSGFERCLRPDRPDRAVGAIHSESRDEIDSLEELPEDYMPLIEDLRDDLYYEDAPVQYREEPAAPAPDAAPKKRYGPQTPRYGPLVPSTTTSDIDDVVARREPVAIRKPVVSSGARHR